MKLPTNNEGKWNRVFSIVKTFTQEKTSRLLCFIEDIRRENDGFNLVFDKKGMSILHWACWNGQETAVDCILLYIQNQVDIKTMNKGETALMIICRGLNDYLPSQNIISKLLKHGSNINCTDYFGNTCLHHAVYNANKQNNYNHSIVRLLKEYHCNVDIVNNNNQRAVDLLKNVSNENKAQVLTLLELLEVRNPNEVFDNMIDKTTKKYSREKNKQRSQTTDFGSHLKIIVRDDIINHDNKFDTYSYIPLPKTLACVNNDLKTTRDHIWSYGKEFYPISICNSDGTVITNDDLRIKVSIALKKHKSETWKVLKIESHKLYKKDNRGAYYPKSLILHTTEFGSRCRLTFSIESKKGNEVSFDKLVWKFKVLESNHDLEKVEYVQCDSCLAWWIIPSDLERNVKCLETWYCHMTSEQSSWKEYNPDVCPCDRNNIHRKRGMVDSTDDLEIQSLLSPPKLTNLNKNKPPSSVGASNKTQPALSAAASNTNQPHSNVRESLLLERNLLVEERDKLVNFAPSSAAASNTNQSPSSVATSNANQPALIAASNANQLPSSAATSNTNQPALTVAASNTNQPSSTLNTIPLLSVDDLKVREFILLERKQLADERDKLMQLISSLYDTRKTDSLDFFQTSQLETAKEEYNLISSKLKSLL